MNLENTESFNLEAELTQTLREQYEPSGEGSQETTSASPSEEAPKETAETPSASEPSKDAFEPKDPEALLQELSLNDPAVREALRQQQFAQQPQAYAPTYAPPMPPQVVEQAPPVFDVGEDFDFTDPQSIAQLAEMQAQKVLQPLLQQVQQQQAQLEQQALEAQAEEMAQSIKSHVAQVNPQIGELFKNTNDPKTQVLEQVGAEVFGQEMAKYYGNYPAHLRSHPAVIQDVTNRMLRNPQVKVLVDAFSSKGTPSYVTPTNGNGGTAPTGGVGGNSAYLDKYTQQGSLDDLANFLTS